MIGALAGFAAARSTNFIDEALKPLATAAGESLLETFRGKNLQVVTEGTKVMLDDAGIVAAVDVPGRVIFPILSYASLEEDPGIQRLWSALLANGLTPGAGDKQLPGFSDILRQLTPAHAHILQWMFDDVRDVELGFPSWPDFKRKDIEEHFGLSHTDYALLLSDMDRLQIVEGRRQVNIPEDFRVDTQVFKHLAAQINSRVKYELVSLTTLGVHFMIACTAPKAKGTK